MESTSERREGWNPSRKNLSPCGVLRENTHYFTAAKGVSRWKLDPWTSKWLIWATNPCCPSVPAARKLWEVNSANTFHLLGLLSPSMVIFVVVMKTAHVHSSSLSRLVMAVVWHWKGCRYTCVSFLADFSISDHWKKSDSWMWFYWEVTPATLQYCLAWLLQEPSQCLHRKELPCHTTQQGFSMHKGICALSYLFHEFCCAQACGMRLKPMVPAVGCCEGRTTIFFPLFISVFCHDLLNLELWTWSCVGCPPVTYKFLPESASFWWKLLLNLLCERGQLLW